MTLTAWFAVLATVVIAGGVAAALVVSLADDAQGSTPPAGSWAPLTETCACTEFVVTAQTAADAQRAVDVWRAAHRCWRPATWPTAPRPVTPTAAALNLPSVDVICGRCGYDRRGPSGVDCPREHAKEAHQS